MAPQAIKRKTRAAKTMKNPPKPLKKAKSKEPTEKPKRVRRGRSSKASFSWTDLPLDPFREIASRLPLKSRYILGFVCTTWSLFVSTILPPLKPKPSFPCLVSQLNNSSVFRGVYLPTKCVYSFGPYAEIEGKICIGCQDGWLILVNNCWLVISLFNPVSEAHVKVPGALDISTIRKVIFSSDPNSEDCKVVVVLQMGDQVRFKYTNTKGDYWSTMFSNINAKYIYDILRLDGSKHLHVITADAKLHLLKFRSYTEPSLLRIKAMGTGVRVKKTLYWDWPRQSSESVVWNSCMVVTKDSNAYEISRRIKMDMIDQPAHADDFSVDCWSGCLCESCKMHFSKVPQKYDAEKHDAIVAVKGKKLFKGHSFFVAENQIIAINAKELSGFESDTVYYVDTCRNNKWWSGGQGRFDFLVLDVAKKIIKDWNPPHALPTWPPPFWFVPMMPESKKKKKKKNMQHYGIGPGKYDDVPLEYYQFDI